MSTTPSTSWTWPARASPATGLQRQSRRQRPHQPSPSPWQERIAGAPAPQPRCRTAGSPAGWRRLKSPRLNWQEEKSAAADRDERTRRTCFNPLDTTVPLHREDRTRWAQRLHAALHHEGWPCRRSQLLTHKGRHWVAALRLSAAAQQQVTTYLLLIEALEAQLRPLESELRHFAEGDPRCQALAELFGVGPIIACHLLAEIGSALRFRRSRQLVRLAGLDPAVRDSGEHHYHGRLAKQGSPVLRWAAVEAAQHGRRAQSPDRRLWTSAARRCGPTRANLTVARKLLRRSFHVLRQVELQHQERAA